MQLHFEGLDSLLALRVVHINVDSDLLTGLVTALFERNNRLGFRGAKTSYSANLAH